MDYGYDVLVITASGLHLSAPNQTLRTSLLLRLFGIWRTTKEHGHFYTQTTPRLVDGQKYIYIYYIMVSCTIQNWRNRRKASQFG